MLKLKKSLFQVKSGEIQTDTGCMYSSKTAELMKRRKNLLEQQKLVIAFKSRVDDRDVGVISSRVSDETCPSVMVRDVADIMLIAVALKQLDIPLNDIMIDEANFFEKNEGLIWLLAQVYGINFHITGLDLTAEQEPFGIMPALNKMASRAIPHKAYCTICRRPAEYSYYDGIKGKVLVQSAEDKSEAKEYWALCIDCLVEQRIKNIDLLGQDLYNTRNRDEIREKIFLAKSQSFFGNVDFSSLARKPLNPGFFDREITSSVLESVKEVFLETNPFFDQDFDQSSFGDTVKTLYLKPAIMLPDEIRNRFSTKD